MIDSALRRRLAPLVPALLLSLPLVTACSQAVAGTPQPGDDSPATSRSSTAGNGVPDPSAGDEQDLGPLVGTWEGEYTCLQGETGLKLTIEPIDDESVRALFEFFPVEENPGAQQGSFQLIGAWRGDRLVFRQEKWVDQPENYLMVDLEVTSPVEPGISVLSGNVLSTNCKGFSVRRE